MKKHTGYTQLPGKAVTPDNRFKHVMAIALDPRSNYTKGIIRCITSREGDVEVRGYVDRSVLHKVQLESDSQFKIGDRILIENEDVVINSILPEKNWDFIGLEDPDIWVDEKTNLIHVYFTIPIKPPEGKRGIRIHLGHAVGKDIDSLVMSAPVLIDSDGIKESAKEVSIAPVNSKGVHLNLVESRDRKSDTVYSIVQVSIAEDMGAPWKYGDIVFHPAEHKIPWIGGHASPGPLLPRSFIDIGKNKLLGIMNGREANIKIGGKTKYGMFSVGLFIYDHEHGKIDWVSPEPFIQDSEAITITFASQFVETAPGKGILYAHVDDSFVRAYELRADEMVGLLPK